MANAKTHERKLPYLSTDLDENLGQAPSPAHGQPGAAVLHFHASLCPGENDGRYEAEEKWANKEYLPVPFPGRLTQVKS
jgi:hypothetical protein